MCCVVRSGSGIESITLRAAGSGFDVVCTSPFVVFSRDGVRREVPCGRCFGCRMQTSREWAQRIVHEASCWRFSAFTTLTYDEVHIDGGGSLVKADLRNFWKRLRKKVVCRIRYYACGEYGESYGRPHYHAIIFGLHPCTCTPSSQGVFKCDCPDRVMVWDAWGKGAVDRLGTVTLESARYTADYVGKQMFTDPNVWTGRGLEPPFRVMSQGLGGDWATVNEEKLKEVKGLVHKGKRVGLPRYYATKLGIELAPKDLNALVELQAPHMRRRVWIGQQRIPNDVDQPRDQTALNRIARSKLGRKGNL